MWSTLGPHRTAYLLRRTAVQLGLASALFPFQRKLTESIRASPEFCLIRLWVARQGEEPTPFLPRAMETAFMKARTLVPRGQRLGDLATLGTPRFRALARTMQWAITTRSFGNI